MKARRGWRIGDPIRAYDPEEEPDPEGEPAEQDEQEPWPDEPYDGPVPDGG